MRKLKLLYIFMFFLFYACKKEDVVDETAGLNIVNAVVGSNPIVVNFSSDYFLTNYYRNAVQIGFGSWSKSYQFSGYAVSQPLMLYQLPDTSVKSVPIYNLMLKLSPGSINSLFLTGTITNPDTLLTMDRPPFHSSTDSSVGIRFINLSPGSAPVNITLSTSTSINEFVGIGYKGVTEFKNYPTLISSPVSSYTFQFRDANTNSIITSQTISGINNPGANSLTNDYRFKNITILLIGQSGGTGSAAQRTLIVSNL